MSYYKVSKLKKITETAAFRARSTKPIHDYKGYKDQEIDILSLYEKQHNYKA